MGIVKYSQLGGEALFLRVALLGQITALPKLPMEFQQQKIFTESLCVSGPMREKGFSTVTQKEMSHVPVTEVA